MSPRRSPIGVDVSSRWIAAVQFEGAGRVRAAACVARVRQGAPDAAELTRLAEVLDRRGFRGSDVIVAAPDDRLMTAALELPPRASGAPVDDLARVELSRTHKLQSGAFEAGLWDVPAGPRATEGGQYMAAAFGHDGAESLVAAFEGASLRVRAIDVRAWGMARACAARAGRGIAALLDLGETSAVLVLVQDGCVVYQRAIPEAGVGRLRAGLASTIGLAPEVVEFVLGGGSSSGGTAGDGLPDGAASLIEEYAECAAAEARAAFEYVARRSGGGGVERLLVMGAGARVPSAIARLANALGVDAEAAAPADLWSCTGEVAAVCRDPRLTVAAGLAVHTGGAGGVNLIPGGRRTARQQAGRRNAWVGVVAAYALVLGGVYAWLARGSGAGGDCGAQIAGLRAETDAAAQDAARIRALIAREESALRASASVHGQPDWSMLFALLARKAGDAIWIESAALRPPGAGAPQAGPAAVSPGTLLLSIAGLGESQSGVSAFVLALEEAGLFGRVNLLETRRQVHNDREVMAFRVECFLELEP